MPFAIILRVSTLVGPDHRGDDDLEALADRAGRLEARVDADAEAFEAARAGLEAFRLRYRQEVGLLHDQLDAIELSIAEAELGELSKKLGRALETEATPPESMPEAAPRFTSDAVRRLFRDVAKTIHPDLAHDDAARSRRHALMIEANRAYALGDEEQLRWILQAWERSPEAVTGTDAEAIRQRLIRRITLLEEQIGVIARDLSEMQASPLWELKTMVDQAAIRGKDIVADMVRRLKRDIMAATNRLDAMRG